MPNALTNTNISATYKGVLHANGEPIPNIGLKPVYDGTGVQSALSVGRTNQGASVTGLLSANDVQAGELRMPNRDNGVQFQVVARTSPGILELKSLSDLNGGGLLDGTYTNPKITVSGGVITNIVSRPTILLLTNSSGITEPVPLITREWYQNMNPFLDNYYINEQYIYPSHEKTIIGNTTINWTSLSGYNADVRYALVTTKLKIQSNGADYFVELKMDNKIISSGEVREDDAYGRGVDTVCDTNQQIIQIPASGISTYTFKSYTLTGSTNVPGRVGGWSGGNQLNLFGLNVTLDGWVY